ncbi:ComEC/Rec2 family competence protein [Microbacterium sp. X-17]|uniref:ComEC/Rec2 family competence protein n=1 Tax=Microbacterium sp. X-17 TaxID=3144404 RepID=UPI0031F4FCF8
MLRRVRMPAVAAAAWAAAGVVVGLPGVSGLLPAVLGAVAVGATLVLGLAGCRGTDRYGRAVHRLRGVLAVLAVAAAAASAASVTVALAEPARAGVIAFVGSGGRAVEAGLVVTGKIEPAAFGGVRFVATTEAVRVGPETRRFAVPVEVEAASVPSEVDVGARLAVSGTAGSGEAGKRETLVLDAREIRVESSPEGALAWTAELRRGLGRVVDGLPEPGAGLVPGLAVGDTGSVDPALDDAMKTASLSHLTAVSGANCVVVVGIAVGLAAVLGLRRGWRVVVGLGALAFFVLLVTPEASVVRAAVMAAIAMVALVLGRRAAGLAVLALAVTVVLVLDPWLSRSLGFALSVAATAALLVLTGPLTAGLARLLPRALALALAVPLAAQLACGPLMLLIRPEVSLAGVVANLLADPAAPLATVAGLAACLAAPLPVLQAGLAAIAWLPAAWIAGVATTVAALPGGTVPWVDGPVGIAALALVGVVVVVAIAGVRWRGRERPRTRAVAVAVVAVLVGAGVGQWTLTTVAAPWTVPADWSIAACDVGQGDAIVVRSAGRVMMIDTGPEPEPARGCLRRLAVDRIDVLVLTHYDLDHVGGVEAVAARVGLLLHGPPGSPADERVLDRVRAERVQQASAGMSGELGGAHWSVVWPPARSAAFPSGNAASIVLSISGGGVPASLYLADLDAASQRALAASGRLPVRADVLKVAHHGSADQDADLYARVGARIALVSVGAGNRYGHPRDSTLAILERTRAAIARTDRDGLVLVAADERGLRLWRDHRRRRGRLR